MPAARYWRLTGVETYGGGAAEVSALQLYDGAGARIDAAATISASHEPIAGALAALQDGDLATICRFSANDVRSAGFWLRWDFGAGTADVQILRMGGGSAKPLFIARIDVQYSSDALNWTTWFSSYGDIEWPGTGVLSQLTGDPHFNNVALLLHGNGPNGSTLIADSSRSPKAATAYAGATISTAQGKFGGASIAAANAASARVLIDSHADFNMGAGDFTVECWAYVVSRSASSFEYFVARRLTTGYWGFWLYIDQATGCPEFSVCNTELSQFKATSTTAFPLGQWVHLAGVRSGSQIKLFVDGAQAATAAVSGTNFSTTEPVVLFGTSDGDSRFRLNGYVDELRITRGVARYSDAFVPPSAAFSDFGGVAFTRGPVHGRSRIAASAIVPPHGIRSDRLRTARDVEFGGAGTVYGTTKTKGTPNLPTKARVVLQHQRSKLPVRETWSDPVTGAFVFTGIDTSQQFLALAEDAEGHFRPVAANRLTPEVL